MNIDMLYSKIHRATITDANLHYVGSVTIDEELLHKAKLQEGQKVEIVNINNGQRFTTYVIKGAKGSKQICINGAASRLVHIGDRIIIIAYASYSQDELKHYKPTILQVDEHNNTVDMADNLIGGIYV
jgi:aspartate 1-decarboxylase